VYQGDHHLLVLNQYKKRWFHWFSTTKRTAWI